VQREEKQNQELIEVSRRILDLTDAIHRSTVPRSDGTDANREHRHE
jgi:hypothetical protein